MPRNSTPISGGFDRFDSGSGARGKKVQHALPVIRWPEIKPEQILVSRLQRGLMCESVPRQLPDLGWGSMIDLADAGVEAAHAAESGSESDLAHGQTGFVDQLLGKVQTARLGDSNRT